MGDTLVQDICESLEGLAFANGLTGFDPLIDDIVNRLRHSGMADEQIRIALLLDEPA